MKKQKIITKEAKGHTIKRSGGFTLVELTVSLSISIIVACSILSATFAIYRVMRNNTALTRIIREVTETEREITTFFYSYDSKEYDIEVSEDAVSFCDFEGSVMVLKASDLTTGREHISKVDFEYREEILKVVITYEGVENDAEKYVFVLKRHSSQIEQISLQRRSFT